MRRLLLCGAGLALWTSTALAGLDLSWNACYPDGGSSNLTPNCPSGDSYVLVGNFSSPVLLGGLNAMDIYIDLQVEGPSLPPFWHFEEIGGCNFSGLQFSSDRSGLPSACTVPTPWGLPNDPSITSYGPELNGPNRARLICTIVLDAGSFRVEPSQNYYAFHLTLNTAEASEGGGACAGCSNKVAVVWNQADLYNIGSGPGFLSIEDPGTFGNCAGWNDPSPGVCAGTPVLNRTWGAIKAQYR